MKKEKKLSGRGQRDGGGGNGRRGDVNCSLDVKYINKVNF